MSENQYSSRLKSWWAENWLTIFLAVLGAGGLAAVLAVIGDIIAISIQYPLPLGALGAFMFLLGVGFAYLAGVRDWHKAKREARKAEEAERLAREQEAKAAELAHEEELENAAFVFKDFDPFVKQLACKAYDDGSLITRKRFDSVFENWAREADRIFECETLPDNKFRYTLTPETQELLDSRPSLLADTRKYIERKQAIKNEVATKANPELMLCHMSIEELQTLQNIVDNGGILDFTTGFEDAHFDTLLDFKMLEEYWDNPPIGKPIYHLDKAVLDFFRQEENKNLIAMYISETLKAASET